LVLISVASSTALGATIALNASFIASEIFGDPNVTVSIRIFGAAIPFATVLNLAVGGIRGQERSTYWVMVKNIVHPVARISLVVVAVLYGLGQIGIAGAYAVPYVISGFVGLALLYHTLPQSRSALDPNRTAEVIRYSLPFTISGISGFVYRSIDIFLILYFLTDAATGIYGVAYAATSFMGLFSTAFNFLSTPIASRLEKQGAVDGVMELFHTVVRWLLVMSVCALVPLGVFATDFIVIIYQSKYADGGIVLSILAVGFAAKNVLSVHNSILEAVGRSQILSVNSTIAAVTNILLNFALIPQMGITGAAIATVVSFMLRDGLAAIQVYLTLDKTPLTWGSVRPLVLGMPFLAVVWAFLAPAIPTTFLWLVGVTVMTGLVYVAAVLVAFGLTPTEVMLIRSAEEQYGLSLSRLDWLIRRLANK
jgi:O-antigen/teichoic acid export membrane protein